MPGTRKSVEFYAGDLRIWLDEIFAPRCGNIWLVGGAMLCQSFLRALNPLTPSPENGASSRQKTSC
jgi:hypothetical protein